jgi:hypothetical protein
MQLSVTKIRIFVTNDFKQLNLFIMATLLLVLVPAVSLFILGYLVITAPEYREY